MRNLFNFHFESVPVRTLTLLVYPNYKERDVSHCLNFFVGFLRIIISKFVLQIF